MTEVKLCSVGWASNDTCKKLENTAAKSIACMRAKDVGGKKIRAYCHHRLLLVRGMCHIQQHRRNRVSMHQEIMDVRQF